MSFKDWSAAQTAAGKTASTKKPDAGSTKVQAAPQPDDKSTSKTAGTKS